VWDRKARRQELGDATRALLATTGPEPERLQKAMGIILPRRVDDWLTLLGFAPSAARAAAA